MNLSDELDPQQVFLEFVEAWQSPTTPDVSQYFDRLTPGAPIASVVALVMIDLEQRWKAGGVPAGPVSAKPLIEDYLPQINPWLSLESVPLALVRWEFEVRSYLGDAPDLANYQERFPQHAERIEKEFRFQQTTEPGANLPNTSLEDLNLVITEDFYDTKLPDELSAFGSTQPDSRPNQRNLRSDIDFEVTEKIGRYRVDRILGQGGFGVVLQAFDDQLQRSVAIKVPHNRYVRNQHDVADYLEEARTVASLDHAHIVPVYDVGSNEQFPFFIVSKLIKGQSLASRLIEMQSTPINQRAELIAKIAEALHYAHTNGVVHRDIKPDNILVDESGQPYVTDFGLALRDEDFGTGSNFQGTALYMSPEQANREGHRVDGRSDLFSLGVVFYQLMTGRLPFQASHLDQLLSQIIHQEPRPPRQINDTLSPEIERICLKLLAKRASQRYTTGKDVANDLTLAVNRFDTLNVDQRTTSSNPPVLEAAPAPPKEAGPAKVIPKGLRSYSANDADFFLQLLPGPHDAEGLPDSIRFWKSRIEGSDHNAPFSVGLLYGPSGCGKSSFVKAGLLPYLDSNLEKVYIEATSHDTENRLLQAILRSRRSENGNEDLVRTISEIRRAGGINGRKLLIIIDQFEQWLHAHSGEPSTSLLRALRQCDGVGVQCLLLTRDDFWIPVTRFFRDLEIPMDGENHSLKDLFELDHAEKVLAALGRAYGRIPDETTEIPDEQRRFLRQAVEGLATDRKVICVRIALLAQMLRSRPWTPATLDAIGGTSGVGFSFLEETFSASTAPAAHRVHALAARGVLESLLPPLGTDIKGHMRHYRDLIVAAGYENREDDFKTLLRILDIELRLITPTSPEQVNLLDGNSADHDSADSQHYQLSHDYLVPSIREWVTKEQRSTRAGRAELRLSSMTQLWLDAKKESRLLPRLGSFLQMAFYVPRRRRTQDQEAFLRSAARKHTFRMAILVLALVLASIQYRRYQIGQSLTILADRSASRSARLSALDRVDLEDPAKLETVSDIASSEFDPQIVTAITTRLDNLASTELTDDSKELMRTIARNIAYPSEVAPDLEEAQMRAVALLSSLTPPVTWIAEMESNLESSPSRGTRRGLIESIRQPSRMPSDSSETTDYLRALLSLLSAVDDPEVFSACVQNPAGILTVSDQLPQTFESLMSNLARYSQHSLARSISDSLDTLSAEEFCRHFQPDRHSRGFAVYRELTAPQRIVDICNQLEEMVAAEFERQLTEDGLDTMTCAALSTIAQSATKANPYQRTFDWICALLRKCSNQPINTLEDISFADGELGQLIDGFQATWPFFKYPDVESEELVFVKGVATDPSVFDGLARKATDAYLIADQDGDPSMKLCRQIAFDEKRSIGRREHAIRKIAELGQTRTAMRVSAKEPLLELLKDPGVKDTAHRQLGKLIQPDEIGELLRIVSGPSLKATPISDVLQKYPDDAVSILQACIQFANEESSAPFFKSQDQEDEARTFLLYIVVNLTEQKSFSESERAEYRRVVFSALETIESNTTNEKEIDCINFVRNRMQARIGGN